MSVTVWWAIYRIESRQLSQDGEPVVGYMAARRGRWVVGSYQTLPGALLALLFRRTSP